MTEKSKFSAVSPLCVDQPTGSEPPRKRPRTRVSSPTGGQDIIPLVDDVDQQMNVDIGNGGFSLVIISI